MPAKDRLADLHAKQKVKTKTKPAEANEVHIALVRQDSIDKFLEKVEDVSSSIDLIEAKMAALKSVHQQSLDVLSESDHKNDREQLMREITMISTNARNTMKRLAKDVDNAEKRTRTPMAYRIRNTQHRSLARRLVGVMDEYNREQTEYRENCRNRIIRQIGIVKGRPATEAETEMVLTTNAPIYTQAYTDNKLAKEALHDIEERHNDIIALEKNLIEIRELFTELSVLIESQNETVDRIEDNMKDANEKAAGAKEQTAGALDKQKKTRRCKIILLVVLVVALIVAAIVIAIQLG